MLRRRKGLPDGWASIVDEHVALWSVLDEDERKILETTTDWLLRHKHWEAAGGFALSDEITVTIAAQAALLVVGLSVDAVSRGERHHRLPNGDASSRSLRGSRTRHGGRW